MAMRWDVWNDWPSAAQFIFNCYRHWDTLVVRNSEGSGHFLHSKDSMTQGDSLAMITYGICAFPLIRELWYAHPRVIKPWYADDAGSGVSFGDILAHLQYLQGRWPLWGYFQAPTKIILFEAPRNVARGELFFCGIVLKVFNGSHYLGGFICEQYAEATWMEDKLEGGGSQEPADSLHCTA